MKQQIMQEMSRPGTLVKLQSGGQLMTVREQTEDGRIYCNWFDGETLQYGCFSPAMLVLPKTFSFNSLMEWVRRIFAKFRKR